MSPSPPPDPEENDPDAYMDEIGKVLTIGDCVVLAVLVGLICGAVWYFGK